MPLTTDKRISILARQTNVKTTVPQSEVVKKCNAKFEGSKACKAITFNGKPTGEAFCAGKDTFVKYSKFAKFKPDGWKGWVKFIFMGLGLWIVIGMILLFAIPSNDSGFATLMSFVWLLVPLPAGFIASYYITKFLQMKKATNTKIIGDIIESVPLNQFEKTSKMISKNPNGICKG